MTCKTVKGLPCRFTRPDGPCGFHGGKYSVRHRWTRRKRAHEGRVMAKHGRGQKPCSAICDLHNEGCVKQKSHSDTGKNGKYHDHKIDVAERCTWYDKPSRNPPVVEHESGGVFWLEKEKLWRMK